MSKNRRQASHKKPLTVHERTVGVRRFQVVNDSELFIVRISEAGHEDVIVGPFRSLKKVMAELNTHVMDSQGIA